SRAEVVVFGYGILQLGWPNLLEAAADATSSAAGGKQVAEGSREKQDLLEQGSKEREKDLDPRRALYLPNSGDPKESERGGGRGIGGVEPRELQQGEEEEEEALSIQGFQLHQIHHHNRSSYFFSSSSAATASSSEYARLPEGMGEGHNHHSLGYNQLSLHHHHHQQQQLQRPQPRPRHGGRMRGGVIGEIVEVQGGHIVRSTGRKDRHSKVCTAKGPRDRRVRLAAHTAIQFYDVQDRLGYDRPSKAVDWLIKNAKAAIDQLAELPPWSPSATIAAAHAASSSRPPPPPSSQSLTTEQGAGEPDKGPIAEAESVVSAGFGFGGGNESPSFLPPSLDTDSIADTIKLFFPVAAAAAAATPPSSSPSVGFQTYSPDVPSRTSSQVKDLRLSLQSFQDPIFPNPESGHHHHHHIQYHQSPAPPTHNAHFPSSAQIAFDAGPAGWAEQGQRIVPWNVVDSSGGGGGYVFSFPPPQAVPLHSVLGQSQFFCQRGPLQSSNSPAIRAWADPVDATTDHRMQPALHPSISTIGFTSGAGFSGFRIPARFQGEEEHDGITSKPPSASRN
ncbi:unnamed protein product, partial [Musa textilis]